MQQQGSQSATLVNTYPAQLLGRILHCICSAAGYYHVVAELQKVAGQLQPKAPAAARDHDLHIKREVLNWPEQSNTRTALGGVCCLGSREGGPGMLERAQLDTENQRRRWRRRLSPP